MSRFSVENFLSHSTEKNFAGGAFCAVFWKVSRSEKDYGGEGGSIKIFRRKFLSHRDEKLCRGILLCFRSFLVSKNVEDKRGGGYHNLPSKLFCLTVPKNFLGEPLCAVFQKISGSKMFMD